MTTAVYEVKATRKYRFQKKNKTTSCAPRRVVVYDSSYQGGCKSFPKKKNYFPTIVIPATPIINNEFLMSNYSDRLTPAWSASTQKAIERFNIDTFGSNSNLICKGLRA